MIYLGIDPGASGGLAVIHDDGRLLVRSVAFGKLSLTDIWHAFEDVANVGNCRAYLERVSAMPRQGVSSTFKFGKSAGALEAFLVAAAIPYELVTPATWQRRLGCLSRGDKNVTKAKAQQLFPGVKVTHAIADALLIAEFGRRHGATLLNA